MVQHERLGEAVQSELRGIVSGAPGEGVLGGQAGDVHDKTAAASLKSGKRLARAVDRGGCSSHTVRRGVDVVLFQRPLSRGAECH